MYVNKVDAEMHLRNVKMRKSVSQLVGHVAWRCVPPFLFAVGHSFLDADDGEHFSRLFSLEQNQCCKAQS